MAVILVITSFSSMVAASPSILKEDSNSNFDYVLYDGGKLVVTCKEPIVKLEEIDEEYRSMIDTIECDISAVAGYGYLEFDGANCPAYSITFEGGENKKFSWIYIYDLPEATTIKLPEGATFHSVDLENLKINSLSFLQFAEAKFLDILDCKYLVDIDIPVPIELVDINACPNLERITANDPLAVLRLLEVPDTLELHLPSTMKELVWYGYGATTIEAPNYEKVCIMSAQLETVTFESGRTKIGGGMFLKCTALKEVDIPETVTKIQYSAFRDCSSLKEVSIPKSVTSITVDAFKGCSSLTDVYFGGSKAQWEKIEVPAVDPEEDTNVYSIKDVFGAGVTIHFAVQPGWFKEDGKWFYLDEDCEAVVSDWVKDGGKWYYLDENGVMVTGWKKIEGKWYYFDTTSGAMKTGWVQDGGSWYYLKSNGEMATGWIQDGGKWYYLRSNGTMYTGWLKDGGKWYYLYPSTGAMACSTSVEIDGKVYNFNASGVCTNP